MSYHVPGYRLAELVAGELSSDCVRVILDHCEVCRGCNNALTTLIVLTTNREAALEALRSVEVSAMPSVWDRFTGWLSRLVRS